MPLTNAQLQTRFRERRDARLAALDANARELLDAVAGACERGRCHGLTTRLPEDPWDAMAELARRLKTKRLIVVGLEGRARLRDLEEEG
jgi:hypothetical protein